MLHRLHNTCHANFCPEREYRHVIVGTGMEGKRKNQREKKELSPFRTGDKARRVQSMQRETARWWGSGTLAGKRWQEGSCCQVGGGRHARQRQAAGWVKCEACLARGVRVMLRLVAREGSENIREGGNARQRCAREPAPRRCPRRTQQPAYRR